MSRQFAALEKELAAWRAAGLSLPLWWRDDDAIAPSPALDRLLDICIRLGATPHLAVVPKAAGRELARRLEGTGTVVLTHGWEHRNHEPEVVKKAEFGEHRPVDVMLGELARAGERTRELFGRRALPVFVPPWNRICSEAMAGLPAGGFEALSAFGARRETGLIEGIVSVNAHIDPVDWHGSRGLRDPVLLEATFSGILADRRTGRAENAEPLGLLTHHLIHDEDVWEFMTALAACLLDSGVAKWSAPFGSA